MNDLQYTRHAEARMRQRGFRKVDVELLLGAATPIAGDAFFLSDQDAAREIEKRRHEIQQFERLRGSKIVVEGNEIVTLYRPPRAPRRSGGKRRRRRNKH